MNPSNPTGELPARPTVPGVDLLDELGRGAHSTVYRGRRAGVDYAVKVLDADDRVTPSVNFAREAALLATLDHPGLAHIHEVGEAAGRSYIVMELVSRTSLADLIAAGPLTEAHTAALATDVAAALAVAHGAGLVHRDVKPDNVMIRDDGTGVLIDFGLAARIDADTSEAAAGTFHYSAPEQTGMLRRPVDARADLYALGAVLFECLTGQPPFRSADVAELVRLHLSAPVPDVRAARPDTSTAIAAIVTRLLAKDPDDRFPTAESLLAALAPLVEGRRHPSVAETQRRADRPVGRDEQIRSLVAAWRTAAGGNGGTVLLTGPAGSGKSTLARAVADAARRDGSPVLHGTCGRAGGEPLAVLREAIDTHLHAADGPALRDALRTAVGEAVGLVAALSPTLANTLGEQPVEADADQRHVFADAVAGLLLGVATEAGGAVLHIDDVHRCDEATGRVLRAVADRLADTPLLVVATARDDARSTVGLEEFVTGQGDALRLRLPVTPLPQTAVRELIVRELGIRAVPDELVARLTAHGGGSPLVVREYLRAVVDAGVVRPSWDTWVLDDDGLRALSLPEDVTAVILGRLAGVGGEVRRLLGVAALIGLRFDGGLVARVADARAEAVAAAIQEAVAHRLVERLGPDAFAFLHDRIHEAVLTDLVDAERRRLHLRVAAVLDGADDAEQYRHVIAHHYLSAGAEADPERVLAACAAAAAAAMAQYAPATALDLYRHAAEAAQAAGIRPDSAFHATMGLAASRTGHYDIAERHLGLALETETDPMRRASVYGTLSETSFYQWQGEQAIAHVRQAMAELGRTLPHGPASLLGSGLLRLGAGLAVGLLPPRWRARGRARARHQLLARLGMAANWAAGLGLRQDVQAHVMLTALYDANRIGPGPEYSMACGSLAMGLRLLGMRERGARLVDGAVEAVAGLKDPHLSANLHLIRGLVLDIFEVPRAIGRHTGAQLRREILEYGRWVSIGDYLTATAAYGFMRQLRGYAEETLDLVDAALARSPDPRTVLGNAFATLEPRALALAGRHAEAEARMRDVREYLATTPGNRGQQVNVAIADIHLLFEQGNVGTEFDRAVERFRELAVNPTTTWWFYQMVWAHIAWRDVARAATATDEQRTALLAVARRSTKDLAKLRKNPLLATYHAIAEAHLRYLDGEAAEAATALAALEHRAVALDLPLARYEIARLRARWLTASDEPAEARFQAGIALQLAVSLGWQARARWIREEFAPAADASAQIYATPSGSRSAVSDLYRRRLEALHRISLVASAVVDPTALTRVVLDEMVRIFVAERAFLFLVDPDNDTLVPHLGRDGSDTDLVTLSGYGSTLVERVRLTQQPLVVTGSDEGAALGSMSAVAHDLRSIMLAPLLAKGRLLGVVYLDSRVATGVFTTDDVDILTAIANQVALSLETARATQLELAVGVAEQRSHLADSLRAAMTDLTATLDPTAVAERLTVTACRILPADAAVLLSYDPTRGLRVAAVHGLDAAPTVPFDGEWTELLSDGRSRHGTTEQGALSWLGNPRAWLAAPLILRGETRGILVAVTAGQPYTDGDLHVADTLAGQGVVALDNAVLFHQVTRIAEHDGLTGLFNRRHFIEFTAAARRPDHPVAGIMIDIDHFKKVNDTYGHPVGDDVIQQVGQRLSGALRSGDVICRYGGEEFAVLLPGATAEDAVAVGNRLLRAVGETPIPTRIGDLPVTISVGVAQFDAATLATEAVLDRADGALYEAKRSGRNRVAIAAAT